MNLKCYEPSWWERRYGLSCQAVMMLFAEFQSLVATICEAWESHWWESQPDRTDGSRINAVWHVLKGKMLTRTLDAALRPFQEKKARLFYEIDAGSVVTHQQVNCRRLDVKSLVEEVGSVRIDNERSSIVSLALSDIKCLPTVLCLNRNSSIVIRHSAKPLIVLQVAVPGDEWCGIALIAATILVWIWICAPFSTIVGNVNTTACEHRTQLEAILIVPIECLPLLLRDPLNVLPSVYEWWHGRIFCHRSQAVEHETTTHC